MASVVDTDAGVFHPYKPEQLLLPHYVPNDMNLIEILGIFFSLVLLVCAAVWVATGKVKWLQNSVICRMKVCWFMATGLIHLILEGYFSIYHETLAGRQTFLAQTWKEYSIGDSRYVSGDTFVVCMETITAFIDGPLAFLAVYAFICNKPYRHIVQLTLSLCQLYGDTLYFMTEIKEGCSHGELWHPLYFWFYFVFMNAIWIIIPLFCIKQSVKHLTQAQSVMDNTTTYKYDKKHES